MINVNSIFKDITNNYILLLSSNSHEKNAIRSVTKKEKNLNINFETLGCYIGYINNFFIIHIAGTSGVSDCKSLGRLVVEILSSDHFPKPLLVVLIGFCWGNPKMTKIGDTILSSKMISLNAIKYIQNEIQFKEAHFDGSIVFEEIPMKIDNNKIYNGQIISCETLFSSTEHRDNIINKFPTILGGEMEAFGFVPTLDKQKIPWLIMKTITDYGDDDFDRSKQKSSIEQISNILPQVIHNVINLNNISIKDSMFILDMLTGNVIKMTNQEFTIESINDFLNDTIAPLLDYKLRKLVISEDDIYIVKDLILEAAQNSFKYGQSTEFTITLNMKNITLEENGNPYDLKQLKGGKGGAKAWTTFNKVSKKDLKYAFQGKRHSLTLPSINKTLRKIIDQQCQVTINNNSIGSGFAREVITVNSMCQEVYIDAREIHMMSRRLGIIDSLNILLQEGKKVYIRCSNAIDYKYYSEGLGSSSNDLYIFYET